MGGHCGTHRIYHIVAQAAARNSPRPGNVITFNIKRINDLNNHHLDVNAQNIRVYIYIYIASKHTDTLHVRSTQLRGTLDRCIYTLCVRGKPHELTWNL